MSVMSTDGGGYTHADWRHETGTTLTVVNGVVQDLAMMFACLQQVKAGRTHLALVQQAYAHGMEILAGGLQYADATDKRLMPVVEAVQAAGGVHEVAEEKTYHTV
jgi:hypothetical protein